MGKRNYKIPSILVNYYTHRLSGVEWQVMMVLVSEANNKNDWLTVKEIAQGYEREDLEDRFYGANHTLKAVEKYMANLIIYGLVETLTEDGDTLYRLPKKIKE